jgi:Nucleoside-diphosphate-sugar epimerases
VERPLPEIIDNNLRALVEVYEGARRQGVKRVVFASSNHAIGMYPVTEHLSLDCALRPDGFYGLSKVWGEALRECIGTSTASRAFACASAAVLSGRPSRDT